MLATAEVCRRAIQRMVEPARSARGSVSRRIEPGRRVGAAREQCVTVEFGLFNSACVLPQFNGDEHRRIMDEVAIVQAADRVGFKYTWATEHHFLTEYSHLSANEVFLGYLAAATSYIHLGSGIFNVTPPVNHPARVAERVALLDHLSEIGRAHV